MNEEKYKKIPIPNFQIGEEVMVKCVEVGFPPHFKAKIFGINVLQWGELDYTVVEPDGFVSDGYSEDWLTKIN